MGIKDWLFGQSDQTSFVEVSCRELFEAAQEYQIRNLAFWTCVNMIANAVGKCEFRTFEENKEVRGKEYYLWNVEPNTNQNSTSFIHKLVAKLFQENEALIVDASMNQTGQLVVADSWTTAQNWAVKKHQYTNIKVGDTSLHGTFYENDVIHISLNSLNIKPIIDGLYKSYYRLVNAAMKNYTWNKGQHWKVHVSKVAQGADGFEENFQKMMTAQVKVFLESDGAVLPEFDGYQFENVNPNPSRTSSTGETRDIRSMIDDIFDFTAKALNIPPVLIGGEVAGTQDAMNRWLTLGIDPLCENMQEEIIRKRYGYDKWVKGSYILIDTSTLIYFDLFQNATNIEKLIGSGYSFNDMRRATGQTLIDEPWANEHFFTRNFDLASNFLKEAKGGENE